MNFGRFKPNQRLDQNELKFLNDYLVKNCSMTVADLHGFITAMVSIPAFFGMSWLNDLDILGKASSQQEGQRILDAIMILWNEVANDIASDSFMPLVLTSQYNANASSEEKRAILMPWVRGYLRAITLYVDDANSLFGDTYAANVIFVMQSLILPDEIMLKQYEPLSQEELTTAHEMGGDLTFLMVGAQFLHRTWLKMRLEAPSNPQVRRPNREERRKKN